MKLSGRRREDRLEPNLTPMIDVIFLLLLFFILSTTFDNEVQLKVELPKASAQQLEEPDAVEAVIAADGRIFLNSQEVRNQNVATLKQALIKAVPDPDTPIVINGDAQAPHQSVIRLMDAARQVGRTRLRFAADFDDGG